MIGYFFLFSPIDIEPDKSEYRHQWEWHDECTEFIWHFCYLRSEHNNECRDEIFKDDIRHRSLECKCLICPLDNFQTIYHRRKRTYLRSIFTSTFEACTTRKEFSTKRSKNSQLFIDIVFLMNQSLTLNRLTHKEYFYFVILLLCSHCKTECIPCFFRFFCLKDNSDFHI